MIRTQHARIVATLGPASRGPERVSALARAGADVFRLNFSHGAHEDHAAALLDVRAAEAETGRPLAALADLQGPKIRLGRFAAGRIAIAPGDRLRLDSDPTPGEARRAPLPHPELLSVMRAGRPLAGGRRQGAPQGRGRRPRLGRRGGRAGPPPASWGWPARTSAC